MSATKPYILLTTSTTPSPVLRRDDNVTGENYSRAVVQAGGLPVLVGNLDPNLADAYLEGVSGLLLTGGADIDPSYFGQDPHPQLGHVDPARDAFELALYRAAKARRIPVLGICRGIQLINVAEGGSLHQHIPALENTIQHAQGNRGDSLSHALTLEPDSRLAKSLGKTQWRSNSFHHQALDQLGKGLRVTARSHDGIIEALEGNDPEHFVLAVQWHPEMIFVRHPEHMLSFHLLLEAVSQRSLQTA